MEVSKQRASRLMKQQVESFEERTVCVWCWKRRKLVCLEQHEWVYNCEYFSVYFISFSSSACIYRLNLISCVLTHSRLVLWIWFNFLNTRVTWERSKFLLKQIYQPSIYLIPSAMVLQPFPDISTYKAILLSETDRKIHCSSIVTISSNLFSWNAQRILEI